MKKQDKKTIWLAMNESSQASYLKYGEKNHERSQGGQEQSERWKIQSSSNQSLTYVSVSCPWNLISWDSKMWKKGHTKWSINELTAFLDGRPVSFISLPFHNKLSRWTDCKSTRSSQLKILAFHQFKTQKFNNKKVLCSCRSNYKNSAQQGLPTLR